ncbi:MAG: fasciclin domain-containing protein, partial [Bacteroidales bacterium]|nr:fasciclin domain-containing protein [Bacteroidales bacterium]
MNSVAKRSALYLTALSGLLFGSGLFTSCEKDILEGQPSWLGNSIYERLKEGIEVNGEKKTFKYTIRLIDDLDQTEVMSHTGSRTLFAATDEAYEAWFENNDWKVSSYEQLTLTQKKLLFNNSVITNAYLLELMSNVSTTTAGEEPKSGRCMRRATASSVYDSVPTMYVAEMPVNPLNDPEMDGWKRFREAGKPIHIMRDNTSAPMIHFLPEFMTYNNITTDDLQRISNDDNSTIADSWINGKKVISTEQTCKNGYIYVVDGV